MTKRRREAADEFDFAAPAELFMGRTNPSRSPQITYRRFDSAAEAIRFAVEEVPAPLLRGAALEVGEKRFDPQCIRELYDHAAYPLARRLSEET